MAGTKTFNAELWSISSPRPATQRILVEVDLSGDIHIRSTADPKETIDLLDGAMEAIDEQRLPPNGDDA